MPYTLAEAARAIGMQKSTVLRAIKRGSLSAMRDASTGQWLVEPAELHRVYPAINGSGAPFGAPADNAPLRTDPLEAETRELRARLGDAHATVDDLRRRLDDEAAERRRLTAVLADLRAPPPQPALPVARAAPQRRWWRWRRD